MFFDSLNLDKPQWHFEACDLQVHSISQIQEPLTAAKGTFSLIIIIIIK